MQNDDGDILEVQYINTKWLTTTVISDIKNILTECIPKPKSNLAAISDKNVTWVRVYYLNQKNEIQELRWEKASGWWTAESVKVGGPRVVAYQDSSLAAIYHEGQIPFIILTYQDANSLIKELCYSTDTRYWRDERTFEVAGQFGTKIGTTARQGKTVWLYYQDQDNTIRELVYEVDSNQWKTLLTIQKQLGQAALAPIWIESSNVAKLRIFFATVKGGSHFIQQWGYLNSGGWKPIGVPFGPVTTNTKLTVESLDASQVTVYAQHPEAESKVTVWETQRDDGIFYLVTTLPPELDGDDLPSDGDSEGYYVQDLYDSDDSEVEGNIEGFENEATLDIKEGEVNKQNDVSPNEANSPKMQFSGPPRVANAAPKATPKTKTNPSPKNPPNPTGTGKDPPKKDLSKPDGSKTKKDDKKKSDKDDPVKDLGQKLQQLIDGDGADDKGKSSELGELLDQKAFDWKASILRNIGKSRSRKIPKEAIVTFIKAVSEQSLANSIRNTKERRENWFIIEITNQTDYDIRYQKFGWVMEDWGAPGETNVHPHPKTCSPYTSEKWALCPVEKPSNTVANQKLIAVTTKAGWWFQIMSNPPVDIAVGMFYEKSKKGVAVASIFGKDIQQAIKACKATPHTNDEGTAFQITSAISAEARHVVYCISDKTTEPATA